MFKNRSKIHSHNSATICLPGPFLILESYQRKAMLVAEEKKEGGKEALLSRQKRTAYEHIRDGLIVFANCTHESANVFHGNAH